MMIPPETYYEKNIKGKTREEIRAKIIYLKKEIDNLKNTMENPDYEELIYPSEDVQLIFIREYLKKAIEAYEATGKKYVLSSPDARAKDFEDNICNIKTIRFTIGGFLDSWLEKKCTFEDDVVKIESGKSPALYNSIVYSKTEYYDKAKFIEKLKGLHLGEWKKRYVCEDYGIVIYDGTEWSLKIEFSNGKKPLHTYGHEYYPYNFNEFLELLGKDETESTCEFDDYDEL